jgi:hypothetical protein
LLSLILSIYLGCWHKEKRGLAPNEIAGIANIITKQILEGSTICCDIKTAEIIVNMPEETILSLHVLNLIGEIPKQLNKAELSFAYSEDATDTIKTFDCKMVRRNQVNVFVFMNRKTFCSKIAFVDYRDPLHFCDDLRKN